MSEDLKLVVTGENVHWINSAGDKKGKGFKTKGDEIALLYCPECARENYAMSVMKGICAWCGYETS